jgi:hypothetical protein
MLIIEVSFLSRRKRLEIKGSDVSSIRAFAFMIASLLLLSGSIASTSPRLLRSSARQAF